MADVLTAIAIVGALVLGAAVAGIVHAHAPVLGFLTLLIGVLTAVFSGVVLGSHPVMWAGAGVALLGVVICALWA